MFKQHPRYLLAVWLTLLFLLPLPLVHLLFRVLSGQTPRQLLLIAAGVVAYTWWLAAIFLATRPAWVDRLIGLPEMYQIHAGLGFGAIVLAFLHFQNLVSMDARVRLTGDWAFYLAVFGLLYASLFLSGILVDRLPLAARLKSRLQHVFQHTLSVWIHRLNLVVVGLIWLHVHLIPLINQQFSFMALFDLLTLAVFGAYAHQKLGLAVNRSIGILRQVHQLTPRVTQLTVQVPNLQRPLKPGDFLFLAFPHHTQIDTDAHPVSVTAYDPVTAEISLTIGVVGDWTRQVSQLAPGASVTLTGPFGQLASLVARKHGPLIGAC